MRKLVVSMNVSLDGCMAGPDGGLGWHHSHWDADMANANAQQLGNADCILLGRITYQAMARHRAARATEKFTASQDIDFAEMMDNYTKIVFSGTMATAGCWPNTRLITRDMPGEVAGLKCLPGKDIMVYGSGKLVDALARLGLVDEYRLWVHPVLIDGGRPLFNGQQANFEFVGRRAFATGVVLMCYKAIYKNQ